MEEKKIIYKDAAIFYKVVGQGKPVILLHGFGEDGEVWKDQVNFLQDQFQLIIPEIPGSGKSELVPGGDIDIYAEIVKLIVDTEFPGLLKDDSLTNGITLVGHSMGGYITLAFAEKYPEYLTSFGLFHSSAFADNEEKKQTRRKAIEFIRANGAYSFLQTSTPALFAKDFTEKHPSEINELIEAGKEFTGEALIQYYEAMINRPDRTAVLKTFPRPILFIIGEYDTAIPLQTSLQQCHLPLISHVHILGESGHMGMWEEAEKANKILQQFLQ
jgi:pimeloyl-ACP methyl ester carboxylesterase